MAKKSVFISNIKLLNNIAIYVWGANGERLADIKDVKAWIYDQETSTENAKTAYDLYLKRKSNKDLRAVDCSGTIVNGLRSSGAKSKTFDTTADGLRTKYCIEINKHELREGDLCFKMGWLDEAKTKWGAVHVGMYVGSNKVIEARGRKWGVVTRSILLGGWSKYGRLNIKWEDEPKEFVLTRLLKKGCKGSDVKALQEKLIKLGYKLQNKKGTLSNNGADSDFGQLTKNAVLELQRNSALKADGIVGENTCKILGWKWQG